MSLARFQTDAARVAAPALIEMVDVEKRFGNGTLALQGMSLQIRECEFVSFLGPSGCGKSTALKMIAGLLSVSSGTIRVGGHAPGKGATGDDVGYVFQEATLMPWATVFDNVYLPLRLRPVPRAEAAERVRAGISKAQLHYYISSKEELYQQVLGSIVAEWRTIFLLSADCDDPAQAISQYVERKLRRALDHPMMSRLFAHEMARGAPEMARHWPGLRASVDEASTVIQGWIDSGRIAPVDPLLFQVNIWAVTQHYADYEAQVRVLTGAGDGPLDADRIIREATTLILRGYGLGGCETDKDIPA